MSLLRRGPTPRRGGGEAGGWAPGCAAQGLSPAARGQGVGAGPAPLGASAGFRRSRQRAPCPSTASAGSARLSPAAVPERPQRALALQPRDGAGARTCAWRRGSRRWRGGHVPASELRATLSGSGRQGRTASIPQDRSQLTKKAVVQKEKKKKSSQWLHGAQASGQ